MQPEQLMALRRADFKTSLVLMAISTLIFVESLNFPLNDSYAGVQNVWYVSPALFPILISSVLFLCGLFLLIKSIAFIKKNASTATAIESRASWWRFFILVALIAGQVFGFVPLVDFALSAFLFLFVFIYAFYSDNSVFQKRIFTIWVAISSVLTLINFSMELSDENRLILDWATLLLIIVMVIVCYKWAAHSNQLKVWRVSWKTALIVTLIVCPVFRLGMLVPLPTEGLVINPMVDAKYVIRDYWRGE